MNIGIIIIGSVAIIIIMKGSPHASRCQASDFLAVAVLFGNRYPRPQREICIVSPVTCRDLALPAHTQPISSDATQAHKYTTTQSFRMHGTLTARVHAVTSIPFGKHSGVAPLLVCIPNPCSMLGREP